MEIPTKFRSVSAGFCYWLLAFILLASSTMLVSCGGDDTTTTITGGGVGAADKLTISSPSTVETGGTVTISVFATVDTDPDPAIDKDEAVEGETITFSITDNQSGSTLSSLSAVTAANGIASVTYTPGIFIPASDEITIKSTNVTATTNIGVIVPGLDTVKVTATPDTLEAIAGGTNNQGLIEALVTAAGTPLAGVSVNFTTTAGSICTLGASTCSGQQVNGVFTGGDGYARITLQSSTNLETATVRAQAGFVSGSADVTFIPGPAAGFTLFASPVNITADGGSTSEVTTLVRDEAGHIVADLTPVSFAVNTATSTGTGNFTGIPPTDETAGGIATQTFKAGTTIGDIDVFVSSGGADSGTDGDGLITLIQESISRIEVVVTPDSLIANGQNDITATVAATVYNTANNPVIAGTEVTISTTGGALGFATPVTGTDTSLIAATDNSGIATVFLKSDTIAGEYFVSATSGGRVDVVQVDFVAGPTDPANSTLTVSPTTIPADGTTTATMTLVAKDANNNPVADEKTDVVFTADEPNAVISDATPTSNGISTATIKSPISGTDVKLDAVIDGQTVTGCPTCADPAQTTITFGVSAATNPSTMDLEFSKTTISVISPAGTDSITITATVRDTNGDPLTFDCPDNIVFTIVDGPLGLNLDGIADPTPPYPHTVTKTTGNPTAGVASVVLTTSPTTAPGTVTMKVSAKQNTSNCTDTGNATEVSVTTTAITVISGEPNQILVRALDPVYVNSTDTSGAIKQSIIAVVYDAAGNLVEDGTAVSFSLADGTLPLAPPYSPPTHGVICGSAKTGDAIMGTDCLPETSGTVIKGFAPTLLIYGPESVVAVPNTYRITVSSGSVTPVEYNGTYALPTP